MRRTTLKSGSVEKTKWTNKLEYYLCTLGVAVGFGSIWRFPYLVYANGGGAFLIPYLITYIVIGIPMFYLETACGQLFQKSTTECYSRVKKHFKGVGVCQTMIAYGISTVYNLLLAYSLVFLYESFSSPLPWTVGYEDGGFNRDFFYKNILRQTDNISDLGGINPKVFIAYVVGLLIVYFCLAKGIQTAGKVAYVMTIAPYVFLTILLVIGLTKEGSVDGIKFLFDIKWELIFEANTWYVATNQVFFQVCVGMGFLFSFSSHNIHNQSIITSTYMQKRRKIANYKQGIFESQNQITGITVLTGIFCAITVFTYMGYMAYEQGIPIPELPLSGPDLVFVSYPTALSMLPLASVFSVLFFLNLSFLGIDSLFGLIESITDFAIEEQITIGGKKLSDKMIRFLILLSVFVGGFILTTDGGFHYLPIYDAYTTIIPMLTSCFLEGIIFVYTYKIEKIEVGVLLNCKEHVPKFLLFFLKYIDIPVLLILAVVSIIQLGLQLFDFPWYGSVLGVFFSIVPLFFIRYYYKKYKNNQKDEFDEDSNSTPLLEMEKQKL